MRYVEVQRSEFHNVAPRMRFSALFHNLSIHEEIFMRSVFKILLSLKFQLSFVCDPTIAMVVPISNWDNSHGRRALLERMNSSRWRFAAGISRGDDRGFSGLSSDALRRSFAPDPARADYIADPPSTL